MAVKDFLIKPTGAGTVSLQGLSPEVQKLAASVNKQKAQYNALTNQSQDSGFGIPVLGRIFDVISRPLYTVANASDYLVKGQNPLEGAYKGLAGEEKTTFDKVLGDMGMSGGFARSALGFGLDIALDPTTYIGGGLVKDVTEGAIRKAGVEATISGLNESKTAIKGMTQKLINEGVQAVEKTIPVDKEAAAKALLESHASSIDDLKNLYKGQPKPSKVISLERTVSKKEAKKIATNKVLDDIAQKAREAEDAVMSKARGKFILKFRGHPTDILPAPISEGIYKLGSKASDLAAKSDSLQKVLKAVRPTSTYKFGTNDRLREALGYSFFQSEEYLKGLKQEFGALSAGERSTITHAIESGTKLEGLAAKSGLPLEEYRQSAMSRLDHLLGREVGDGILHEHDALVNYVPHVYETADRQAANIFKNERSKLQRAFLQTGEKNPLPVVKSIAEAKAEGLKPVEDIVKLIGMRSIDSFKEQAQVRFAHALENEFGIHLGEKVGDKLLKKDVPTLAKKMNLIEGKSKYLSGKGVYFHPDVAKVINTVERVTRDPAAGSEIVRLFDKVQQVWKLNMTALNPGHHIRNFMGDVFLNFEDGVIDPRRYHESMNILKNWKDAPNAIAVKIGNMSLTNEEVMRLFTQKGGKSGFWRTEIAESGFKPVETIRNAAEVREDWTRLAHFVDVLRKEGKNVKSIRDLDTVATEAGRRVRKFNIDYGDLTPFERNGMKRVIPFYTWMRKNIPIQLETLAMNPGKIATIPKGLNFLNSALGQQGLDPTFMGLNMVPLWLRQAAGVRVAGEGQGRNGVYWNPSVIPFMDIGQYTEGGLQGVLSTALGATSPLIRAPIELATNRSLLTGGQLQDTGLGYAGQSVLPPTLPRIMDLLKGQSDATDIAKLLGISLQNVGPQQQKGELRRQQDIVSAKLFAAKQKIKDQAARQMQNG